MEERIRENIERETSGPEQINEGKRDVFESQNPPRKNEEPNKEEVLKDIYSQQPVKKEKEQPKPVEEDKKIDNLVKESRFGSGINKTIKKAIKMGAYFIDALHDKITGKRKEKE